MGMTYGEYHGQAQNKTTTIIPEGLKRPNDDKYHQQNLIISATESALNRQMD